jgi:hypothetical protein
MLFPDSSEENRAKQKVTVLRCCAVGVLCITTIYCARALQSPGNPTKPSDARPGTKALNDSASAQDANLAAGKTQSTPLLSELAARPATVTLKNEILTVEANNSDLSQILKKIADVSGMIINGSITSARVYGVYGPGSPSEVLTNLLTGSGYNFMMVGLTHEGAPRQLLLTLRIDSSAPAISSGSTVSAFDHRESADGNTFDQGHLGPGAIVHAPPPPPQDTQERVQQNLRRLEQMHDQPKPQD